MHTCTFGLLHFEIIKEALRVILANFHLTFVSGKVHTMLWLDYPRDIPTGSAQLNSNLEINHWIGKMM